MSQTTGRTETLRTSRNAIKIINQADMSQSAGLLRPDHRNNRGHRRAITGITTGMGGHSASGLTASSSSSGRYMNQPDCTSAV